MEDYEDDDDILEPGEVVFSPSPSNTNGHAQETQAQNNWLCYRIEDVVGEGRCCVVYSAHSVNNSDDKVAIKCYRRGDKYSGAVSRERYILDLVRQAEGGDNIVLHLGSFPFKGCECQVMELLDANVRQVIFRNGRRGLNAWGVQKFAKDMLSALSCLHSRGFVHADLKPANVMWSSNDGCFKIIDFGLTFHEGEGESLHQVQTDGYRAPEAERWNKYKNRRKTRNTYRDLTSPQIDQDGKDEEEEEDLMTISESSGVFTASEDVSSTSSQNGDEITPSLTPNLTPNVPINKRHSLVMENRSSQEWRIKGAKKASSTTKSGPPPRPGAPCDMWSFGCLLHEVLTGSKLFVNDRLASVLRPGQLVQMRAGPAEAEYGKKGMQTAFSECLDLIQRCLSPQPQNRPTAEAALKHHPFLKRTNLTPDESDLTSLPTSIVRIKSEQKQDLEEIKREAGKYGAVSSVEVRNGHVFVEFCGSEASARAFTKMRDGGSSVVYYPTQMWAERICDSS